MTTNKPCVVILSGGMDSFTLLHQVLTFRAPSETHVLSFNYGQRHGRELEHALKITAKLGTPHQILSLNALRPLLQGSALTSPEINVPEGHYEHESMKLTVVPGRNTIMLSIAMGYAESIGADFVAYGAHSGDHHIYPDCRPLYISKMKKLFAAATESKVRLEVPFQDMTKGDILAHGLSMLGLVAEDYADTYTCYKGGEVPCGVCGACQERSEAFAFAKAIDPTAAIA